MIGHLISALIGAFVGYFFNVSMNYVREQIKKRNYLKKSNKLLKDFQEKDYTFSDNGIITLAHGVPAYIPKNISLSESNKSFYIPIPTENGVDGRLKKYQFTQEETEEKQYDIRNNCLSPDFWGTQQFNKAFSHFGHSWDDAVKEEIYNISIDVAENFHQELTAGKIRFNGALYGVEHFTPNRSEGEEIPTVDIKFYVTDYFTFRVFATYYTRHFQEFKENNERIDPKVINEISYPFLSSFGIACIIIVSENDLESSMGPEDIIIVGKRSHDVIVDQNKLHFAMNEALSLRDATYKTPSFDVCVTRGLAEELHITDKQGNNISQPLYTDICFDSNKCEMGISVYLRMKIDENFTPETLSQLYKEAQDSILETKGLEFVKVKDLEDYIRKNQTAMSAGFNNSLNNLLRRYKMQLL